MSIVMCVLMIVGALVAVTAQYARHVFARSASHWPGFIDRRVTRVQVGEGAFRDQTAESQEDRVVPPGMPAALRASSIVALIVGSPVFIVAALIFSVISGRAFAQSLLIGFSITRAALMFAGALLWLAATVASLRGAVATIQRRADTALGSLRFASIAQLFSLVSLAYVALTNASLSAYSLTELLVVAWPLVVLLPVTVAWATVRKFAHEMRGHGQGIVTTDSGVRVAAGGSAEGGADPLSAPANPGSTETKQHRGQR